jgi:hypothetical protein
MRHLLAAILVIMVVLVFLAFKAGYRRGWAEGYDMAYPHSGTVIVRERGTVVVP